MKDELQAVGNAWRHRSLRFGHDGVTCTADVEEGSILLFEPPVVEERDPSYPEDVRTLAAALVVPDKRGWFPAQGTDVESMAHASCMDVDGRRLRFRFLHFFKGGTGNARLRMSPFSDDSSVMLVAARTILAGERVFMETEARRDRVEEAQAVETIGDALLADVRARDRWTAVGIESKIVEFRERCARRGEEFKCAVKDGEGEGDAVWATFLRNYAAGVSVDLSFLFYGEPLTLLRSPVVGSLDCEEAARVLETRKMLGVSDLEKKMREQLEELKNFKPPDERIEDYDTGS